MRKWYFFLITFLILVSFHKSDGQTYELSDIVVNNASRDLEYPFAGGLRAPQFNTLDINLDGILDILIFDREGNITIPLIRKGNGQLEFRPEHRSIFPEFNSWVLFRDYNNDGIKDIFCAPITVGIPGVQVYTGVVVNGQLEYQLLEFPQYDFDILYYPIGSTVVQVYVSPADIPEVRDGDGDGDLDILAFEPAGSTIFYFRNMSVERDLPLDQLEYRVGDQCYGGIFESGFSEKVTLSTQAGVCATALWEPDEVQAEIRHAGSTVTSYDINGNGLQDLLLGDVSYDGVVHLSNTGTQQTAWMTEQKVRYPSISNIDPVEIQLFVTTSFEDIDNDGQVELLASSNSRSSSQGREHVWSYNLEIDGDSISNYNLISKNSFVDEMIYTGTMSAPVFYDLNNDGLQDLLIGTSGRSSDGIEIDPRMVYYANTGTASTPEFTLTNNNYLNMAQFATTSRHFAPTLGDIDGDGDVDMVIGDETGRLYLLTNLSGEEDRFSWTTPQYDPWGIKVSAWAKPLIIDLNKDGLGDLIIGEQNFNSQDETLGSLNYFQNQGSPGNPNFNPDIDIAPNNSVLGEVFTKQDGFINNYSAPTIVNIGDRNLLAVGTERGNIFLYDSLNNSGAVFVKVNNFLGGVREGNVSAPTFADIDGDQLLEMAIGTRRGGIAIYESDILIDVGSSTSGPKLSTDQLTLSPNPTNSKLTIQLDNYNCNPCQLEFWSVSGQLISSQEMEESVFDVDISDFADGIYITRVLLKEGWISQKLVKIHTEP